MGTYLVTGGAGFIGSHLTTALVAQGQAVRVFDNFSTGRRENLAGIEGKFELVEGDLRKPEDCRRACQDIEVVYHEGAVPSVPKSVADPVTSHEANIDGTFNLLSAARAAGCRRVVYAASSSAYGDTPTLPKREEQVANPLSPYAVQKLAGEHYCRAFYECFGLETIALRYFNVFGPRQDPKSQYAAAIPAFVTAILADRPPTIYGDGEQTRDFTYIDNVVHANLLCAKVAKTAGQVLNLACGERISINRIIARINEHLGKNVQPIYEPMRPGDVRDSLADISRAREVIGFEPQVCFDDGLGRAIDWYRENWSA
ncbi:MAG: SDR family oxidoreductase [Phycisphaerae bacterium]|nr:SDR family oxidoreductase [Phycisphaerae bacterium]